MILTGIMSLFLSYLVLYAVDIIINLIFNTLIFTKIKHQPIFNKFYTELVLPDTFYYFGFFYKNIKINILNPLIFLCEIHHFNIFHILNYF